jgi:hypothetical protein
MYSPINSNVKLGMAVEAVRLQEIRQQIEAQRVADEIKAGGSDRRSGLVVGWLGRASAWLIAFDQKQGFTPFVWKLIRFQR